MIKRIPAPIIIIVVFLAVILIANLPDIMSDYNAFMNRPEVKQIQESEDKQMDEAWDNLADTIMDR